MYKKIAVISVLMVGSAHAMDGRQTLQVVVNTPVAKTLRWLSSGKPEANLAAGAIAVCIAKSGFDLVSWPVRAWLSAQEKQNFVGQLNEIRDSVKRTERAVAIAQNFTPEQLQKLEGILTTANAIDARIVALNSRFADLEAQSPSRESAADLETIKRGIRELKARTSVDLRDFGALCQRVEALEKREPVGAAGASSGCSCHAEIEALRKQLEDLAKKNSEDHASIRKDNLSMFAQKLGSVETDLATLRSQVKILQDVRTGQSANQK